MKHKAEKRVIQKPYTRFITAGPGRFNYSAEALITDLICEHAGKRHVVITYNRKDVSWLEVGKHKRFAIVCIERWNHPLGRYSHNHLRREFYGFVNLCERVEEGDHYVSRS